MAQTHAIRMIDGHWRVVSGSDYTYAEARSRAAELNSTAPQPAQVHDTDSGLGIGGIGNDQSAPRLPTLRGVDRVQRMHDTDTVCRKCGASKNFDGVMFTTLGGSNICDDCAG